MTYYFIEELVTFYCSSNSSGPVHMGNLPEIMDQHQNKYFWSCWLQNWHYCTWICPWLVCQNSLFPTIHYISVFDNVRDRLGRQTVYIISHLHLHLEHFAWMQWGTWVCLQVISNCKKQIFPKQLHMQFKVKTYRLSEKWWMGSPTFSVYSIMLDRRT